MRNRSLAALACCGLSIATVRASELPAQELPLPPDARYQADALVILGHPDDDTVITPFLARAVLENHKRVAVVFCTDGSAGGNAAGMEQSRALGRVRELEARRSLAYLGIDAIWFLHAPDTPGQDVLHSLENWHHGNALDDIVRIVRLTRPSVILTMLPAHVPGENHGDHQAAAVLAVEAFDVAGSAVDFPEQLEMPRDRRGVNNYGEGLLVWQPKKIYFFDADGLLDFSGQGPSYSATATSVASKLTYGQMREKAWSFYRTQDASSEDDRQELLRQPAQFVLGKSLVSSTLTGDVFEGVDADARPSDGPIIIRQGETPPLAFGGPLTFYPAFWARHGLDNLASHWTPISSVDATRQLWVAIDVHNDRPAKRAFVLEADLPDGWAVDHPKQMEFDVDERSTLVVNLNLTAPSLRSPLWQQLKWTLKAGNTPLGELSLRVHVEATAAQ